MIISSFLYKFLLDSNLNFFFGFSESNLEGDSIVVEVEVCWVLSEEWCTKSDVVLSLWHVNGFDTELTF